MNDLERLLADALCTPHQPTVVRGVKSRQTMWFDADRFKWLFKDDHNLFGLAAEIEQGPKRTLDEWRKWFDSVMPPPGDSNADNL